MIERAIIDGVTGVYENYLPASIVTTIILTRYVRGNSAVDSTFTFNLSVLESTLFYKQMDHWLTWLWKTTVASTNNNSPVNKKICFHLKVSKSTGKNQTNEWNHRFQIKNDVFANKKKKQKIRIKIPKSFPFLSLKILAK